MLMPCIEKLQRATRQFASRIAPGALILAYHRVGDKGSDPWSLCVSPQHFAQQLEALCRRYSPVSLQRLSAALRSHQQLSRSVVITFDDGYADNLHQAKPLLERYNIPATVFVISRYVGSEREFWWDEMERLILQPDILPDSLGLLIRAQPFEWTSSGSPGDGQASRQSLYHGLWRRFRFLKEDERRVLLDQLQAWSHAEAVSRSTHRPISAGELLALGEGELIEIGSHTATHPFLSKLSAASQEEELRQSRRCLEEIVGLRVTSFSYPHGDYDRKVAALVAEAGYTCACSSDANAVRTNTDRFRLPRIVVEDWDGEEFDRRLSEWLGS